MVHGSLLPHLALYESLKLPGHYDLLTVTMA